MDHPYVVFVKDLLLTRVGSLGSSGFQKVFYEIEAVFEL